MPPRLAKTARITPKRVEIDGELFPYYIAENGVEVLNDREANGHGLIRIRIDVLIDGKVEIEREQNGDGVIA